MSRRREYLKAAEFNSASMKLNLHGIKIERPNNDIICSEVIDFAARLFYLSAKKGRTKLINDREDFDEAV